MGAWARTKPQLIFWTDVLLALLFLGLVWTGVVMTWILPPGSGGGGRGRRSQAAPEMWSMNRHDWGDVHFWIAAAMVGLVMVHLALHWRWVLASLTPGWVKRRRGAVVS